MSIAEINPVLNWTVLIAQGGIAGIVLGWFMWRMESRLKSAENSIDRIARANLLLIISLDQANDSTKLEAKSIVQEIDAAKIRNGH